MKQILFPFFVFFAFTSLHAQTPFYLLFTRDCMDQLESRYTYNNANVLGYSLHPNANEQYLLTAGSNSVTSSSLPKGSVSCGQFTINEGFLDAINKNTRTVYIVHQTAGGGYLLMPVVAATQVVRYGSIYQYKAPNFAFAVDTANLVYGQNIALPGTNAYIYFTGHKMVNCRAQYTFRRESTQNGLEKSDFEFIPGIGIITDRTGKSALEAENNQLRLLKFNGLALEDYLNTICPGGTAAVTPPVSRWTPEMTYNPTGEPDKEAFSMSGTGVGGGTTYGPPRPIANCPIAPGYGYHIAQPGESLNSIARAYGLDPKAVAKWNKIKNADHIEICQKISLIQPGAKGVVSFKIPTVTNGPTAQTQLMYWQTNNMATPLAPAPVQHTWNAAPPQPETPPAPGITNTVLIHIVQNGESVSSIARSYGLTEQRFRQLNNLPLTGDVVIYPGQPMYASEFRPIGDQQGQIQTPGMYSTPTNPQPNTNLNSGWGTGNPNTAPGNGWNTPSAPVNNNGWNNLNQPVNNNTWNNPTQPVNNNGWNNNNTPGNNYYQQPSPYGDEKQDPFQEEPVNNSITPETSGSAWDNNTNGSDGRYFSTPPATNDNTSATKNLQEYVVRQGETITSIATKLRVNARELAITNNLDINARLLGGDKLLVPK